MNLGLGSSCLLTEQCLPELACTEGYCLGTQTLGQTCDSMSEICIQGLICDSGSGLCVEPFGVNETCTYWQCQNSLYCLNNLCTPRIEAGQECQGGDCMDMECVGGM